MRHHRCTCWRRARDATTFAICGGSTSAIWRSSSSSRSSCTAVLTSMWSTNRPSISRHADRLLVDLLGRSRPPTRSNSMRTSVASPTARDISARISSIAVSSTFDSSSAIASIRSSNSYSRFSSSSSRWFSAIIASSNPPAMRPMVASRLAILVPRSSPMRPSSSSRRSTPRSSAWLDLAEQRGRVLGHLLGDAGEGAWSGRSAGRQALVDDLRSALVALVHAQRQRGGGLVDVLHVRSRLLVEALVGR